MVCGTRRNIIKWIFVISVAANLWLYAWHHREGRTLKYRSVSTTGDGHNYTTKRLGSKQSSRDFSTGPPKESSNIKPGQSTSNSEVNVKATRNPSFVGMSAKVTTSPKPDSQQKLAVSSNLTDNSQSKNKHLDWNLFNIKTNRGGKFSPNEFLQTYEKQCEFYYSNQTNHSGPQCPCLPQTLDGRTKHLNNTKVPELSEIVKNNSQVQPGGYWKPSDCYSRDRVAIIIPFRDRQFHLNILLKYLHPLLQRQQIEYRIFVIEQTKPDIFNKASLMNSGYLEVRKLYNFDCVVFHDVDMIPEDDRNFYTCMNSPRHVCGYNDRVNYRVWYTLIFGGAVLFKPKEFQSVNGFSNRFYGWGGEDDDMSSRVFHHMRKVYRYPNSISRYTNVPHQRDKGNPKNHQRHKMLRATKDSYLTDGLNNLVYNTTYVKSFTLYTKIFIELPNKPNT